MEKSIIFEKCKNVERNNRKYLGKHPLYKNVVVYRNTKNFNLFYKSQLEINSKIYIRNFDNDKDAAKWVDLKLIEYGKNPVNVLKKK